MATLSEAKAVVLATLSLYVFPGSTSRMLGAHCSFPVNLHPGKPLESLLLGGTANEQVNCPLPFISTLYKTLFQIMNILVVTPKQHVY